MSTVISNALYIKGNNYKDIDKVLKKFKTISQKEKLNLFFEKIINFYYTIENDNLYSLIKYENSVQLSTVCAYFMDNDSTLFDSAVEIIDYFSDNEPSFFNDFTIVSKIYYKVLKDKTLFIISGKNSQEIHRKMISNKIKDYSYWNNTDKPDKIKNFQWKEREKDWEFINYYIADEMSCFNPLFKISNVMMSNKENITKLLLNELSSNIKSINSIYKDYLYSKEKELGTGKVLNNITKVNKILNETLIFEDKEFMEHFNKNKKTDIEIINEIMFKKLKFEKY